MLLFALARRRLGWGGRLALTLAGGWWAGFLTMVALVDGLGVEFRMTPPRGDNWAGVTGMTLAALWFFRRTGYPAVAHAMLVAGAWGAVGFAGATAAKLVEVKYVPLALEAWLGEGRWQTNWHSVLEQTYGFINGLGIAAAMRSLARRQLPADEEPVQIRWVDGAAVAFVLLAVPYVNLVKNVPNWVKNSAIPAMMVGLPARAWFDVMFGAIAVATLYLIVRHRRQRLAVVPAEPLGGAQLLFVAFLWTVVVGNWMRAIPPFAPQRLITEGVIHVNAVLCTVLALCAPRPGLPVVAADRAFTNRGLLATAAACLAAVALFVAAATGVTRAVHGDKFAGHGGYHVRFGPDAKSGKPQTGLAHP